jgi:hypothetical protein
MARERWKSGVPSRLAVDNYYGTPEGPRRRVAEWLLCAPDWRLGLCVRNFVPEPMLRAVIGSRERSGVSGFRG